MLQYVYSEDDSYYIKHGSMYYSRYEQGIIFWTNNPLDALAFNHNDARQLKRLVEENTTFSLTESVNIVESESELNKYYLNRLHEIMLAHSNL